MVECNMLGFTCIQLMPAPPPACVPQQAGFAVFFFAALGRSDRPQQGRGAQEQRCGLPGVTWHFSRSSASLSQAQLLALAWAED